MKKINKLSLTHLSKSEMERRELNSLKGGECGLCMCMPPCPCLYEGPQCPTGDSYWGGSSTEDNADANSQQVVAEIGAGSHD